MSDFYVKIAEELSKKGIRPSFQRIKVLAYMKKNLCHPTAEKIFNDLHGEIPSLSKSTVYNTLNTFIESGLVKALNIEENETRYDIITESHGHFKCDICGIIYNFTIDIEKFAAHDLGGFNISDKSVYFKGTCKDCLRKKH